MKKQKHSDEAGIIISITAAGTQAEQAFVFKLTAQPADTLKAVLGKALKPAHPAMQAEGTAPLRPCS